MKPVSIRFKCFGPYMDEQFIDFSLLEKSGIFLICGETGAGKTTILDAMCYALYGKSSGGLRGDMSVMRCKLAGAKDETLVEFVFDCGGRRYKFVRTLKYGRKNLNDSHNCMELREGEYVPIFANPKARVVNEEAQRLIGLTYEQFRQVIVLPQGQFERLLVSNSAEKEAILVSLFHADRWQRIADEIHRRVTAESEALRQERQRITMKLNEHGCENLEQLAEKTARARESREALRESCAGDRKTLEGLRQLHDRALVENRDFEELEHWEARVKELLGQQERSRRERWLLDRADLAQQLQPRFLSYEDAQKKHVKAQALLEAARRREEAAARALTAAEEARRRVEARGPEYEARKRRITLLEAAEGLYRSLAEREAAANDAMLALEREKKALDRAAREFERKDRAWNDAVEAQSRAIREFQEAQRIYRRGIGSTLARELEPGVPCPVCGSREHPSPARPVEGHVTDAQLEERNRAMNRVNDGATEAMKARSDAETRLNQARSAWAGAEQAAALKQKDLADALAQRIEGIGSREQLLRVIREEKDRTARYEAADADTGRELTDAQSDHKAARSAAEAARCQREEAGRELEAQAESWRQALAESGLENEAQYSAAVLDPAENRRRRARVLEFDTDLSHARQALDGQKEKLQGRQKPDLAGLKARVAEQEQAHTRQTRELTLLEKGLEGMESDLQDLSRRTEVLKSRQITVEENLEFATRLSGRSGISLQRYVLGVMLTSITVEANRLLRGIYAGRYQLYRTDETAGSARKSGLELEVYDLANDERRSVTTLSGGEKFLVALSLAIGLSTVVQAQSGGMRLEAMFIDEGFGTLDRESVGDALEVLRGIGRGCGVVGVISHVEQLAEVIPTKIEIRKGQGGSSCRLRG